MAQQSLTIDILLNLVPDRPDVVLTHLQSHPSLSSAQDENGYSLLHAAVAYNHVDLASKLVKDFAVDPNLLDEDRETCLFHAETVDTARAVLDLGVDLYAVNIDGQTAMEKLADEDEQPLVAEFLREHLASLGKAQTNSQPTVTTNGASSNTIGEREAPSDDTQDLSNLPPMPPGVQINLGTMSAADAGEAPDPELRRRIEELAARPDFESPATQQELRELISDALSSVREEGEGPRAARRRIE